MGCRPAEVKQNRYPFRRFGGRVLNALDGAA
jgi:hypothetical protein